MEAGRELDALVAEKVMGWRWIASSKSGFMLVPPTQHERMLSQYVYSDKEGSLAHKNLGHYSTNIADAWKVVEKMDRTGNLFFQITREQIPNDANGQRSKWAATIWDNKAQRAYEKTADTAPLAICLAALKAVSA